MKKYTIILLLLLFFESCYLIIPVPYSVKENFSQCYNCDTVNSENKIHFDGLYLNNGNSLAFFLFKDGLIAYTFFIEESLFFDKKFYNSPATQWGTYKIQNDTINVQILVHHFNSSLIFEKKYKILKDTTILLLTTKCLNANCFVLNDSLSENYIPPYKFKKIDKLPNSSCWLKDEKWFWCDKKKFKEYKKTSKSGNSNK